MTLEYQFYYEGHTFTMEEYSKTRLDVRIGCELAAILLVFIAEVKECFS
jgi:hypothetical protein